MTVSLGTAYRSFGGEVEASNTPTICRLHRFMPSPTLGHSSVLVAIETLAVLLGPARVLVLLPVSRGFLCQRLRRLASLHRFVLLFGVAVLRDRHDRGVDHLAAARDVAFGFKVVTETREQLLD